MVPHTPEWPVAFFDEDYLLLYRPHFQPALTDAETRFIADALGLAPGSEVLDLACGSGRHAIGMARLGHRVTGLDFNARYLEIAAADAAAAGVSVTWTPGDMRELGSSAAFDAVYSYFSSFGYFDDVGNERVLAGVARVLRPGGRFLLETVNRDWLLTHPQQRTWSQRDDGALLMEETALELVASRVVSRQILLDPQGGTRLTKEFFLRAYSAAELSALMRRHGLEPIAVLGGADGAPYSTDSRRMTVVAERRA